MHAGSAMGALLMTEAVADPDKRAQNTVATLFMMTSPSPGVFRDRQRIAEFALTHHIATVFVLRELRPLTSQLLTHLMPHNSAA
jgi:hypothetical protein